VGSKARNCVSRQVAKLKARGSHAPSIGERLISGPARAILLASTLTLGALSSAFAQGQQTPPPATPGAPAPQTGAAQAGTPQPIKIDPGSLLILIRTLLITLDQANKTGDYSVLRDMGAPDFVLGNSPARLAEIFASQRSQQLDMASVAILEPQLTLQPQIEANGMLHFGGFYPAGPAQLKFEFLLQSVSKQWRLYGLAVNLAQAGANPADAKAAPANPPAAASPPAAENAGAPAANAKPAAEVRPAPPAPKAPPAHLKASTAAPRKVPAKPEQPAPQ